MAMRCYYPASLRVVTKMYFLLVNGFNDSNFCNIFGASEYLGPGMVAFGIVIDTCSRFTGIRDPSSSALVNITGIPGIQLLIIIIIIFFSLLMCQVCA